MKFEQAYDSVDRSRQYKILLKFGVPAKLVELIEITMVSSSTQVKKQNEVIKSSTQT